MKIPGLFLLLVMTSVAVAQTKNKPGIEFPVHKASDLIKIDGELTEESWKLSTRGQDFWVTKPIDSIAPTNPTFFYITFDENFLYIGFECMDDGGEPIVQSLRRDFDYGPNDNVGIYINTYNDFTNGFYFNITPYGVQREGTVANAGTSDSDYSSFWDNKWYSAVKRYEDKWVAELAIPFKSIRYNISDWNFNVLRNDVERNQVSSWIAVPVQYMPASFQNSGRMIWQEPLPKPGMNVSLIPYITAGVNDDPTDTDYTGNIGFDAKVAITPSVNLDLTVNPDFSNVEVDRQVINLTRFEVNFPERRQFFLENSDLFSTPGFMETRPFFTRRIGIVEDADENLMLVPLQYGARLSGKLGQNWRVGILNTQTKEEEKIGLPAQNYTTAVVQRQIFERSNIDFVFVNKESLGLDKYDSKQYYHKSLLPSKEMADTILNTHNRVIGSDFNLLTANNRWNGDVYYMHSFDDFNSSNAYSAGMFLGYSGRNMQVFLGGENVGEGYNPESGFAPQIQVYPGYNNGFLRIENPMYPKKGKLATVRPGYGITFTRIPNGTVTDKGVNVEIGFDKTNTAGFGISYDYVYQRLTKNFNPIDNENLPQYVANEEFAWHQFSAGYGSDARELFSWDAGLQYGGYYTGELINVNGGLAYRFQPFGSLSVRVDYNDIRLGSFGNDVLFLVSPRFDFTFTDKLFLTTFVQYNSVADNVNLNARFQWRFKPASDFFVVYTENYLPEGLVSKNRALVLKLTYWFNL